jgi:hypothetical protein
LFGKNPHCGVAVGAVAGATIRTYKNIFTRIHSASKRITTRLSYYAVSGDA